MEKIYKIRRIKQVVKEVELDEKYIALPRGCGQGCVRIQWR